VSYTIILETVHGSQAYGLATAASDVDRKGVFVGDFPAFLGYRPWPEQVELTPDHTLYDIRKFFTLAAACNPTVIEVLFTLDADRTAVTAEGELLLARRGEFLSRRAGDSFGRYGLSQLRRIKTHRRWLLSPPVREPEPGDRIAQKEWHQYQEWVKKRNPKRAELERQHGYDTKHAMHLVRLLRMAREILTGGEVVVRRPDAAELRRIREGALTFDELLAEAERMGGELPALAQASPLPVEPDEARLDALCVEIASRVLRRLAA
jgi:predicted nucleotidyltransferase